MMTYEAVEIGIETCGFIACEMMNISLKRNIIFYIFNKFFVFFLAISIQSVSLQKMVSIYGKNFYFD